LRCQHICYAILVSQEEISFRKKVSLFYYLANADVFHVQCFARNVEQVDNDRDLI
jgi:hypothetical protein